MSHRIGGAVTLGLSAVCTLALGAGSRAQPANATAAQAWLDGDTEAALAALAALPSSRERDFNRAAVLLYRGEAVAAERIFEGLRVREPRWLPAARWLARTQKELERPECLETALAVLGRPGATSRDHFAAARLLIERNDLPRARDSLRRAVASEDDLYLAWVALAQVENALGHLDAARAAHDKAEALYPVALSAPPAPPPRLPSPLRYKAKYLSIPFATLTLSEGGPAPVPGRAAWRRTLEAQSSGANVFFRINSRFESDIASDGALVGHRNLSNDSSSAKYQAVVGLDPATGVFRSRQVRDGLFLYDVLPLPPGAHAHDGLTMIDMARAVARTRTAVSVLRIVDSTWKGSVIRPARAEPIRWQDRKVDTVCVEIVVTSRSAAGTVGVLRLWISADDRAIPYRARMGIAIGSVTLELTSNPAPASSGG
jgi:tetratricopeptide (TPR) repeat protein